MSEQTPQQTVWLYAKRGAGICVRLGIFVFLTLSFVSTVGINEFFRGGVSFWILIIILLLLRSFVPKTTIFYKAFEPGPLIGGIAAILVTMSRFPEFNFKQSLIMLASACQITLGAIVAGTVLSIWIGLFIGTICGIVYIKLPETIKSGNYSIAVTLGRITGILVGNIKLIKISSDFWKVAEGKKIRNYGIILPIVMYPITSYIYLLLFKYIKTMFFEKPWISLI